MRRLLTIIFTLSLGLNTVSQGAPISPKGVSDDRLATEMVWKSIRDLKVGERPKITLVLGGGGARGLSHIGVLRVFEQEQIPIDQIVGVSVGALIGALYAGGIPVDEIEKMANEVGWNNLTDYNRIGIVKLILNEKLLSTEKMETYLETHLGKMEFSDLKIPFSCVATDIQTGERVVFDEGPVAIAARASATVPGIFRPVNYQGRLLVDGGLTDNLPSDLAGNGNFNYIVGIMPKSGLEDFDVESVFSALIRSIEIQHVVLHEEDKKTANTVIEPDLGTISMIDVARAPEAIEIGEVTARQTVLELKKKIITHMIQKRQKEQGT